MVSAVPLIGPLIEGKEIPSRDRAELPAVDATPLAVVGQAPQLLAQLAVNAARRPGPASAPDESVFAQAGKFFAESELLGESPTDYQRRVALATGTPIAAVVRATEGIRASLGMIGRINQAEYPVSYSAPHQSVQWVPRGGVLTAVVPNNHPEPNVTWVRALAMGANVLIRPGSKDPFTPRRLLAALLSAGIEPGSAALVPSAHRVGDFLLEQSDLGLVYGGPDVAARFATRGDVLVRGPGRSKVLLGAEEAANPDLLDALVHWISFDGGVRCNNISVVLTSGPVDSLAKELAERLSSLPVLPVLDRRATLPAIARDNSGPLRDYLDRLTAQVTDHSSAHYGGTVLADAGDNSVVLRPLVVSATSPTAPIVGTELGFPFVVVAPWTPGDGLAVLGDSLVVSLPGEYSGLAAKLLRMPSVRKVVTHGTAPWAGGPEIPHDGSLAQFLLEPKGLVGNDTGTS